MKVKTTAKERLQAPFLAERAAIVEEMPDPNKWACGVPDCSFRQVIAANTRD